MLTWKLANLGVAVSLVCSPQYKQVYIVTDTQNASHLKSRSIIKPPLATARAASCDGPVHLFVCLYVCLSVAKMQKTRFSQKLSNLELWSLLTTYRKSYMGFQRTHYWTPKIQDA